MSKQDRYFEKIAEYKERFRNFSIEKLEERLALGNLYKEAAIAYRELLEEKRTGMPDEPHSDEGSLDDA